MEGVHLLPDTEINMLDWKEEHCALDLTQIRYWPEDFTVLVPAHNETHFKEGLILAELFPDEFTTASCKQLKCLATTECTGPQLLSAWIF